MPEEEGASGSGPAKVYKAGLTAVSVWEREGTGEGAGRTFRSFNVQRAYKKDDEWKYTTSLNVEDIPRAVMLLQEAYKDAVGFEIKS